MAGGRARQLEEILRLRPASVRLQGHSCDYNTRPYGSGGLRSDGDSSDGYYYGCGCQSYGNGTEGHRTCYCKSPPAPVSNLISRGC